MLKNNGFRILFPEVNNMDTAFGSASIFLEKLFQAPVLHNDQDIGDLQWHDIFSL